MIICISNLKIYITKDSRYDVFVNSRSSIYHKLRWLIWDEPIEFIDNPTIIFNHSV